ncbi:MAG: chromate transporter [Clostridia bacterium]|nr:chromate transporter [Clostridia bacterium]
MKLSAKEKLKSMLKLFAIFFKIGLFSFGGGYAMFTMIEREVVEKHKFLTHDELMDVFAIAESTPGAVAINVATFVGTRVAGIFGGIFATFGLMLPSMIIIMALSYIIDLVRDNKWVGYLFKGIRAGVLVLIAKAVLSFFRNMRKDWFDFVLLIPSFLIAFLTDVSVIYIILGTIVICILALVIKNAINKKKAKENGETIDGETPADENHSSTADDNGSETLENNEADDISVDEQAVVNNDESDNSVEKIDGAENKTETSEGGID